MTAWLWAALGALVLGAAAWLRRALQQAKLDRDRDDQLEQIIVRNEKAHEVIDTQTATNVTAVPGKPDAELEAEINR